MEERLNQEQLAARIAEAKTKVEVGAHYEHYKKMRYIVRDIALWEETNEPCVVYQAQYGAKVTFIRPLANWLEDVDVNGQKVPRFKMIDRN